MSKDDKYLEYFSGESSEKNETGEFTTRLILNKYHILPLEACRFTKMII